MMEEKKGGTSAGGVFLPFLLGFVAALAFGWWGFPHLLYSQKTQPLLFTHQNHVELYGMMCEDCHFLRQDGSFSGLPDNEKCGECHSFPMGEHPEEIRFVEEFYEKGIEVPWLVYQFQPDNVWFSHAAHQDYDCTTAGCHPDVASSNEMPNFYENRLTKYSRDTMKMNDCESCHATVAAEDPERFAGAPNACQICHK